MQSEHEPSKLEPQEPEPATQNATQGVTQPTFDNTEHKPSKLEPQEPASADTAKQTQATLQKTQQTGQSSASSQSSKAETKPTFDNTEHKPGKLEPQEP